ncbi:MAG: NYN domain-containing protein, partial [Chlorobi bacterium CHB2]|nr:NYN domain-containing protein [Chlorobi bacterium CHB2]
MNNNTAARAAAAAASRATAAVFVDYGNLFSYLKNSQNESTLVPDSISDIIRGVERQLDRKLNQNAIALKAYADFEELRNGIQSTLYEMGVETRNVAATGLNDSADLQLSIDALDLLYTRPEITTFVIVCADRDYIPLVQHIKRQGRNVILATLRTCISPDMLQFIGPSHYIDVAVAADPNVQRQLEQSARGNNARGCGRSYGIELCRPRHADASVCAQASGPARRYRARNDASRSSLGGRCPYRRSARVRRAPHALQGRAGRR